MLFLMNALFHHPLILPATHALFVLSLFVLLNVIFPLLFQFLLFHLQSPNLLYNLSLQPLFPHLLVTPPCLHLAHHPTFLLLFPTPLSFHLLYHHHLLLTHLLYHPPNLLIHPPISLLHHHLPCLLHLRPVHFDLIPWSPILWTAPENSKSFSPINIHCLLVSAFLFSIYLI